MHTGSPEFTISLSRNMNTIHLSLLFGKDRHTFISALSIIHPLRPTHLITGETTEVLNQEPGLSYSEQEALCLTNFQLKNLCR